MKKSKTIFYKLYSFKNESYLGQNDGEPIILWGFNDKNSQVLFHEFIFTDEDVKLLRYECENLRFGYPFNNSFHNEIAIFCLHQGFNYVIVVPIDKTIRPVKSNFVEAFILYEF